MTYKALISLLFLSSCAAPQTYSVTPFDDRPDVAVTFQHHIKRVNGTVWLVEKDGSAVIHHFSPVGVIQDRKTYVTSFSYRPSVEGIKILSDETTQDVAALIEAAERYCIQTGFVRTHQGASLWISEDQAAFVEFCLPKDVALDTLK